MWSKLSAHFFKGLIILLPLLITLWLLSILFAFADGILGGFITLALGRSLPGIGFLTTVLLILLAGYLGDYILGVKIISWFEGIVSRVPIVKSIYSSAKQVNEVFFQSGEQKGFNKACLVQYPRQGIYSIGFITTYASPEIQDKSGKGNLICVFIPNTPTPATGFLIMVPSNELIVLDMKIDEAFKYIVSAGVLKPADLIKE